MKIITTDTSWLWSVFNPVLEEFRHSVTIVCLNGHAVSDKFECFLVPRTEQNPQMDIFGPRDERYTALSSVLDDLKQEIEMEEDIIFLTDNDPTTLYPFHLLKKYGWDDSLHLLTVSPWSFDRREKAAAFRSMLSDLTDLTSVLYYDAEDAMKKMGKNATPPEVISYIQNYFDNLMEDIIGGILRMGDEPCFFDFASLCYVPLEEGFDGIEIGESENEYVTMGKIIAPEPMLREQRIRLAEANNIEFESEECPSIGACAGTCEKCDREADYLRRKLSEIPEENRVYPQFDPTDE